MNSTENCRNQERNQNYNSRQNATTATYRSSSQTSYKFLTNITSYTAKGREKIHKSVQCVETQELRNVMKYRNPNESIEFNDNSILHTSCNRELLRE